MSRVVSLVVALAVVIFGVRGAAQTGPVSAPGTWLAWSSSDVCGDAAAFAARVERALGRSPARAAAEAHVNVTAQAAVAGAAGAPHWVGEVHLSGDDRRDLGSRTLDRRDISCQPLVDALAVVTALALADDGFVSPERAASPDRSLPTGSSATAPAPVAPETALVPARPPAAPVFAPGAPAPPRTEAGVEMQAQAPERAPRRWRSWIEAGPKVGIGMLPRPAFGAEVSVYLRPSSDWKVFLAFDGWQRQTTLDDLGRGASFQRLMVGLGVCPVTVVRERWEGAACLRGDVGRLNISGVGFASSSTEDRLTLDAGLGVDVTRRLMGPLAVGLSAGVTAPLIRDRISYATAAGGVTSIFRESPVAAVGAFRLSFVF